MKVDEGLMKQYPFLLFIFFSWRCRLVGYSEGRWGVRFGGTGLVIEVR